MGRTAIPIVSPKETVSSTPVVWVGPHPTWGRCFLHVSRRLFFQYGFLWEVRRRIDPFPHLPGPQKYHYYRYKFGRQMRELKKMSIFSIFISEKNSKNPLLLAVRVKDHRVHRGGKFWGFCPLETRSQPKTVLADAQMKKLPKVRYCRGLIKKSPYSSWKPTNLGGSEVGHFPVFPLSKRKLKNRHKNWI